LNRFDRLASAAADGVFDLVVVDGAQRIKNASSSTAESCRLLQAAFVGSDRNTPAE
jgi:SNF2 family DNA or RNA helicase